MNMQFDRTRLENLSMNEEMIKLVSSFVNFGKYSSFDSKINLENNHCIFVIVKKINSSNINYFNPISITESILPNI